jgi:outer membrane lipoprotein SlyB
MNLHTRIIAVLFAVAGVIPLALVSGGAQAQQSASKVQAPRIDGFDVEPARELTPGSELMFTMYGSPGGTARVRIGGAANSVALEEVEAGVYEGSYTIKSRDKITATSTATANLRLGNRVASALLDEPLLADARAASPPIAQPVPRIDRFGVDPGNRMVAGEDLIFTLNGTPGGEASVRIAGIKGRVDLPEISPGLYEGGYIIKSRDRIAPDARVTANLRVGAQTTNATLAESLIAGAGFAPRPRASAQLCANCGVIEAINEIQVEGKGSFLGILAGGVAGGLLGSQIGSGRGTTVAQIAGAAGGALAGNEVEKRMKKTQHYEVVVRLENGGTQTISYPAQPSMRVGDRVRVENGTLVPNA